MSSPPLCPTILLVEDCDDDAFFFARLLKKWGGACRYVHVSDGRAALDYLGKNAFSDRPAGQTGRPDLIFLDLKLPVVTGFEILEWLVARNFTPRFEVSVLSGSDQGMDLNRADSLGVSGYFVKPLRLEQLQAQLELWQTRNGSNPERDSVPLS